MRIWAKGYSSFRLPPLNNQREWTGIPAVHLDNRQPLRVITDNNLSQGGTNCTHVLWTCESGTGYCQDIYNIMLGKFVANLASSNVPGENEWCHSLWTCKNNHQRRPPKIPLFHLRVKSVKGSQQRPHFPWNRVLKFR